MNPFTPDQPWFYLLLYGSFMVALIIVGIILAKIQQKKQVKENEKTANN
ncbi:MAG: hypothetical protein U9O98_03630 [Asgard group archaeon]|nr:hypothetical protein [Asgard group archaeon]